MTYLIVALGSSQRLVSCLRLPQFIADLQAPIAPNLTSYKVTLNDFVNSPELVDAWKVASDAFVAGSIYKQDKTVLESIQRILSENSSLQVFDHDAIGGLENFLRKYNDTKCTLCGNQGYKYMPALDEILDNTVYCLRNYGHLMDNKMFGGELMNSNLWSRDGIQHMFKHMRENRYESGSIARIGGRIHVNARQELDILFMPGNSYNLTCIEYKSYKNVNDFIATNKLDNLTQFKEYLSIINSLDEINYVFNASKLTESQWRTKFKNVFQNYAQEIWEANPNVFFGKSISLGGNTFTLSSWQNLQSAANHNDFVNSSFLNFIKAN